MHRLIQIGSVLLLLAGASFGRPKDAPRQQTAAPTKAQAKKKDGAAPKEPIPKGAPRIINPQSPAVRLFRMSPEERERAIAMLPTDQARMRARKELEWFDRLPKEDQDAQLRRLDHFTQLAPEKKAEVFGMMAEINHLPAPRAVAVRQALYRLQKMNDQQRENTLHRPEFQARFSPEELRIINGLADAWMGPIN